MSKMIAAKATCEIKSVGARERATRLIESKRETLTSNPHSLSTALLSSLTLHFFVSRLKYHARARRT